ncbi:MAG: alpha/beta hydrolase domain-containing protein [Betaproteobacteria bacterium]
MSVVADAAIPNPTLAGPIPPTVAPGDPAHDYPFLSTNLFPVGSGYIEQEFSVQGNATRYSTTCAVVVCPVSASNDPVTVVSTGHAYKIRMVVRRPSDPAKYNGRVIVEWFNVTGQFELDVQWYRASEHFIREGFAYVGVGPQRVGIHANNTGLRAWSPTRYGTLDVTAGGTITDDALKWDIFSQVGQAIKNPVGVDPLGGLQPRTLIATGDSQSSANLATYLNSVHRLDPIYAGAVFAGPLGIPIRPDVTTKVLKVPGEWDVIAQESPIRQPDTANVVSWEVAGMSHSPYHTFTANAEVRFRDVGVTGTLPGTASCIDPTRSRVHSNYIFHAAYEAMVRWLQGVQPPSMPGPITLASPLPTSGDTLARDQFGIALGGIRLPAVSVPIATNTGWNAGGKAPTTNGTCQQAGTHIAFTDARLRSLYASHQDYVTKVAAAAALNVIQGFLLPEDAAALNAEAEKSDVLAAPRADGSVRIVEFFHPAARRYVWTAEIAERSFLDFEGGGGGGWFRTGETFFAWPAGTDTPVFTMPVCRLLGTPGAGPLSHFYSPDPAQCAALVTSGVWISEGTAFRASVGCTAAMDPVQRLWRAGTTVQNSRHRFALRNEAIAKSQSEGFVLEGQVFCGQR